MSDTIAEGSRFTNTDRGIIENPRKKIENQAYNPHDRALAKRRRFGTIAKTTAAVALAVGGLMATKEIQHAVFNHDIPPTRIEVGQLTLTDKAKIIYPDDPDTGADSQISWDQISTPDGTPFSEYKSMQLPNALIREVPEAGNPHNAYAILDNVIVGGKTVDLEVAYNDPNLGHSLDKGFSDIGSLITTPDGKYQATYNGDPIDPDIIGTIIPGQPK